MLAAKETFFHEIDDLNLSRFRLFGLINYGYEDEYDEEYDGDEHDKDDHENNEEDEDDYENNEEDVDVHESNKEDENELGLLHMLQRL